MALAAVRSIDSPRRLVSTQDRANYEQELADQSLLASVGAGCCDATVASDRSVLFEFIRYLGRPVWTAKPADADRFLAFQRKELGRAHSTVAGKAFAVGQFFDFLVLRYQGDIHPLTGHVIEQVIDEFNKPSNADYGAARVPPGIEEVELLFDI